MSYGSDRLGFAKVAARQYEQDRLRAYLMEHMEAAHARKNLRYPKWVLDQAIADAYERGRRDGLEDTVSVRGQRVRLADICGETP
jgi:hypothetical protein